MTTTKLLALLTPHDVAKDSLIYLAFTGPWAFLTTLDRTLVFGVLNLVVLTFFRWRTLRLREKELALRHSEEVSKLRVRLSQYEDIEPARPYLIEGSGSWWRRGLRLLSRLVRTRGASRGH